MRWSFPAKIAIVQSPCKHVVEAFAAIAGLVDVKMCVVAGGCLEYVVKKRERFCMRLFNAYICV